MSNYKVEFAGTKLEDYCKILSVSRDVLPPRENFSKNIPTLNGSLYTGYHYKERYITISVAIIAKNKLDFMVKVRALANVLDVKNPSRLYISDEPNIYYYAVLDEETEIERAFKTGTIDLVFVCHNPIGYNSEWKSFLPDAKKIFTLENMGTTDTYPYLMVNFKNRACFLQCTNPKGETVLIGQPKDSTLPTNQLDTTVINDSCNDSSNFLPLAPSLITDGRIMDGMLGVGHNGSGLVCTNFGNLTDERWCGGGLKRALNANLEQFEVEISVIFSSQGSNYTPPSSGGGGSGGGESSSSTYKVTTKAGLNVREQPTTSSRVKASMPYNTQITVSEVKNGWARHNYKNLNGWSSMDYLKKVSSTYSSEKEARAEQAETELGIIEVYGFDANGATLFVNQIYDGNQYYEFVEPKVFIGTQKVLGQTKSCPTPRKVVTQDDNGKETSYYDVSGVFGDFNDCVGKFVIRREKGYDGSYLWSASFLKYDNGVLVKRMDTQNAFSSSTYPKGALNSLGIFIGRYGNHNPVDIMVVDNIKVTRLNPPPAIETNLEIFEPNDKLEINFQSGEVLKNGKPYMTHIDIGSEFFTIPSGRSQMIIKSDDESIDAVCGIQERFL